MNDAQRVAALEREVAELKARLDPPVPKLEPQPKPYLERGVSIITILSEGAFEMPTDDQLRRLLSIVHARYDALRLPGGATARDRALELPQHREVRFLGPNGVARAVVAEIATRRIIFLYKI